MCKNRQTDILGHVQQLFKFKEYVNEKRLRNNLLFFFYIYHMHLHCTVSEFWAVEQSSLNPSNDLAWLYVTYVSPLADNANLRYTIAWNTVHPCIIWTVYDQHRISFHRIGVPKSVLISVRCVTNRQESELIKTW